VANGSGGVTLFVEDSGCGVSLLPRSNRSSVTRIAGRAPDGAAAAGAPGIAPADCGTARTDAKEWPASTAAAQTSRHK